MALSHCPSERLWYEIGLKDDLSSSCSFVMEAIDFYAAHIGKHVP